VTCDAASGALEAGRAKFYALEADEALLLLEHGLLYKSVQLFSGRLYAGTGR
jgi:hypothetical protein